MLTVTNPVLVTVDENENKIQQTFDKVFAFSMEKCSEFAENKYTGTTLIDVIVIQNLNHYYLKKLCFIYHLQKKYFLNF